MEAAEEFPQQLYLSINQKRYFIERIFGFEKKKYLRDITVCFQNIN